MLVNNLKVAIVGLGLMGGSLGLELQKLPYINEVVGYDHNDFHQQEAIGLKLINKIASYEEVIKSDIIILAIPVDAIVDFISNIKQLDQNQLIIDFGSTKSKIVKSTPLHLKKNFVPAHPMTGTEKFGPSAAMDNLYRDKNIVICDLDKCGEYQKELALKIFLDLSMNITQMDSVSHDRHAAFISHMPHILSFSLANSVMAQEDREHILSLAAGGFKDMSRIAKSSPKMWVDVARQNKDNLLKSIEYFQKELDNAKQLIENDKYDKLFSWMESANKLHNIL